MFTRCKWHVVCGAADSSALKKWWSFLWLGIGVLRGRRHKQSQMKSLLWLCVCLPIEAVPSLRHRLCELSIFKIEDSHSRSLEVSEFSWMCRHTPQHLAAWNSRSLAFREDTWSHSGLGQLEFSRIKENPLHVLHMARRGHSLTLAKDQKRAEAFNKKTFFGREDKQLNLWAGMILIFFFFFLLVVCSFSAVS